MRSIFFVIVFFAVTFASAQEPIYFNDFDKAMTLAKSEQKDVLLYFSGSDWCRQCLELKKTVLEKESFKKYAREHFVLINADFPKRKNNQYSDSVRLHFNELAEKYNPIGAFPTLVLFNSNAEVLQEFSSVNQFRTYIEELIN